MGAGSKSLEVRVLDGGALSASLSSENVGESNYVKKINLRRFADQEKRREGWIIFKPDPNGPDEQAVFDVADFDPTDFDPTDFSGSEVIQRLAELRRPDGEHVIIGAGVTKLKKFDSALGVWVEIGSGYLPAKRWQALDMNGYLILNNGKDLPVTYRVEDEVVTPIYELREVGIASVGFIEINNGYLMLADITEIQEDQLDKFMDGYTNFIPDSLSVQSGSYTLLSGDAKTGVHITTGDIDAVVTLPTTPTDPTYYVWLQKRDAGLGQITTIPPIINQAVVLKNQNDQVFIWWNPVLGGYSAKLFLAPGDFDSGDFDSGDFSSGGASGVPTYLPYGIVPTELTNHIPWQVANGEFGQPRSWAPGFNVWQTSSSATITLPFESHVFIPGQTRVAVENGGPDAGTLGGDELHPVGVLVTAVAGNVLTLEIPTDSAITYPRVITIMRWTDTSTLVSRYSLQDDSSAIIGFKTLDPYIIVYRVKGIYSGRYIGPSTDINGNVTGPFKWTAKYHGANVPKWGDCIASVGDGDYHLYPADGGRFYKYDGLVKPVIHKVCDLAREIFFDGTVKNDDECWSVENPVTKEVWFVRPGKNTLAFDYEQNTCSEIDVGFRAAAYVQRPNSNDKWFILSIGGTVLTYGLVDGEDPIETYLRAGQPVNWVLKSGLTSLKDQINEKDVFTYTPLLSSYSPNYALYAQLYTTFDPSVAPVARLSPVANLPDPNTINYIALFFRAIYFQIELTGVDTRDIDCRFSCHLWEYGAMSAGGVNRRLEV